MTVNEAAKISNYHAEHIRELVREGRVKARKFATVWQVSRKSLLAYIRAQQGKGERRGRKPKG